MRTLPYKPPTRPTIAIVGEAPGVEEELRGQPFVGSSGKELTRMLQAAGINRFNCYITNVFWDRPPQNNLDKWCVDKTKAGKDYPYPLLSAGKYLTLDALAAKDGDNEFLTVLATQFDPQRELRGVSTILERLRLELQIINPNIIIALGNTACWALLGKTKISTIRGTVVDSSLIQGTKVLPTFHPAAVIRNWGQRPIVISDLMKAAYESRFPDIRRPRRSVWIAPEISDLALFWTEFLGDAKRISVDIETANGLITCIGFAPSKDAALVVPFAGPHNGSYWRTAGEEVQAWNFVRRVLQGDSEKLFHNGIYDIQYLWRAGIAVKNAIHDSMILHHALQPELPKALGFLGSIYTSEPAWKLMRKGSETTKLEE